LSSTSKRPASCTARTTIGGDSTSNTSFDFLSYTFRPRLSKEQVREAFRELLSGGVERGEDADAARDAQLGVARRSDKTLTDLALMFNRQLQGWINYYGRFYKSMCIRSSATSTTRS